MNNDSVLRTRMPQQTRAGNETGLDTMFAGGETGATRMTGMAPDAGLDAESRPEAPKKRKGGLPTWLIIGGGVAGVVVLGGVLVAVLTPSAPAQPPVAQRAAPNAAPAAISRPAADPAAPSSPPQALPNAPAPQIQPGVPSAPAPMPSASASASSSPTPFNPHLAAGGPASASDAAAAQRIDALERRVAELERTLAGLGNVAVVSSGNRKPTVRTPGRPAERSVEAAPSPALAGYRLRAVHPGIAWVVVPSDRVGESVQVAAEGTVLSTGVQILRIDADRGVVITDRGTLR